MTYSIIGRDPNTGELGLAVQSRFFAAGRLTAWIEAGVGAVASQAFAEPRYGYEGLALLKRAAAPQAALDQLTQQDQDPEIRQVAIGDTRGTFAVRTGARCVQAAGHALGANCVAQANMMTRDTVWSAMTTAFEATPGALEDRLLAALEAAESEGGDIRGAQAAALIVVSGEAVQHPALGRRLDLRVDDHSDPVGEVRRQLAYARAHQQALEATARIQAGDTAGARAELEAALQAFPREPQFLCRYALALMASGDFPGARHFMAQAIAIAPHTLEFVMRMADAGSIPVPRAVLAALAPDA
jgi:uncharacterized Ntn-hydrolase superfamily protein